MTMKKNAKNLQVEQMSNQKSAKQMKKNILQVFTGAETMPRPFIYRKGCHRTVPVIACIVKLWLCKCALKTNHSATTHRPNGVFLLKKNLLRCFSHHFVMTCVFLCYCSQCRSFSTEDVAVMEPNKFAIRWRIAGTANVPFPGLEIKPYIVPRVCTMILACPIFNMSLTALTSTVHGEDHNSWHLN